MPTVALYEKNGVKRGVEITRASIEQVFLDPKKGEYYSRLFEGAGGGPLYNIYTFGLDTAHGTVRIRGNGREGREDMVQGETYEVWL